MTIQAWEAARREFWERQYASWAKDPRFTSASAAQHADVDVAAWEKTFPRHAETTPSVGAGWCPHCVSCWLGSTFTSEKIRRDNEARAAACREPAPETYDPDLGRKQEPRRYLVEVVDQKDEKHGLGSFRGFHGKPIDMFIDLAEDDSGKDKYMSVKELPPMPSIEDLNYIFMGSGPADPRIWPESGIYAVLRACGLEPTE